MKNRQTTGKAIDLILIGIITGLFSAAIAPVVHVIMSSGHIVLLETIILCTGILVIAVNVTMYAHTALGTMIISWTGNIALLLGIMVTAPYVPTESILQTFLSVWVMSLVVICLNILKHVYIKYWS